MTKEVYPIRKLLASLVLLVSTPSEEEKIKGRMQRHVASSQHDLLSVAYQRCKERLRSCHSGTSDSEVIESPK